MDLNGFRFGETHYRWWRDHVCGELLGLEAPRQAPPSFDMRGGVVQLGCAHVALLENFGESVVVHRSARSIACDPLPSRWMVGVCLQGCQVTMPHHGAAAETFAGGIQILPSDLRHSETSAPATRIGALFLPEGLHPGMARWAPTGGPAREGLAAVLAAALTSMYEQLPRLSQPDAQRLVLSLLPLIDAVAAPSPEALERARPALRVAQRRHVLRFIETHLADPALRPRWIATSVGISLRYLHALFEDQEHTVGELIWNRRLERCLEALTDPGQAHRSLTEIAFGWGFSDTSHFSRAFRRRFGVPPSELRRSRARS